MILYSELLENRQNVEVNGMLGHRCSATDFATLLFILRYIDLRNTPRRGGALVLLLGIRRPKASPAKTAKKYESNSRAVDFVLRREGDFFNLLDGTHHEALKEEKLDSQKRLSTALIGVFVLRTCPLTALQPPRWLE